MLKLSPSKISTYLLCPFKYKCEINTQIRNAYKRDTPNLVFGNLIHACLNDFFKRIDESERNFETLRRLFKEKFEANWDKHKSVFETKENMIRYVEESKKQFKTFIDSELSRGAPYLIEEFPKYTFNLELELGGKFDRVDREDKELILIDYKTGKIKEDNEKGINFQLNFYEYLLNKLYPEYTVKKKVLFFLKENQIIPYENHIDLETVEKEIVEIARIINADYKFDPTPNRLCRFCDYQSLCPIMNKKYSEGGS